MAADAGVILQPGGLPGRPLLFGEVLFDEFQDGSAVLGGAPFNVAWHLQAFGLVPLLISRVGEDELGRELLGRMHAHGLDTRGIQRDPHHPTGRVRVLLDEGQPLFSILPDQAYDYIAQDALPDIGEAGCALLYHGSLALRHTVSREALERLRETGLPVFIDINLRPPWWERDAVETLLHGGRWLKLNNDELAELTGADPGDGTALLEGAEHLRAQFGLQTVIVTRGAAGVLAVTADGQVQSSAAAVPVLADTVGAGDGFSAVMLLGIARGWSLATTLHRAAGFAAALCAIRGAVPADTALYKDCLREWTR